MSIHITVSDKSEDTHEQQRPNALDTEHSQVWTYVKAATSSHHTAPDQHPSSDMNLLRRSGGLSRRWYSK